MKTTLTDAELELSLRVSLSDEQVAELTADDIPAEYDIDYSTTLIIVKQSLTALLGVKLCREPPSSV